MAYSFQKMFFIGQNLKLIPMKYSFLELLILFWTTIDIYCLEFISHHIKEILHVNTNSNRKQSWKKQNKEIFIFTYFWYWCWKILFLCRVKIPYQQFLTFLSLMNIFRSSRLQMFFKIAALKIFAIFWIKRSLQHRCFPVNIAKFLRTAFL